MGLGRRPLLVMLLIWVAVVGAVGAITFVVVSDAGSAVGRASAAERVVVASTTASASATVRPTATPTATPRPTPPATLTKPATPTPAPSPPPDTTPEPRVTSKAPAPTAPAVDPRTASFTTEGGTVVATCRGSRIYLKSIRPRDGWRFDREYSRLALEVSFKTEDREVELKLSCVDEVPTRAKEHSSRSSRTHGTEPESR